MPEGPEIKLYTYYLNKYIKKLINIKILKGRYKRHKKPKFYYSFKKNLPSKMIKLNQKENLYT